MKEISIEQLKGIAKAGDILLTSNPQGIGTVIRWFQELQGDPAFYTHTAIIPDSFFITGYILDANGTLDYKTIKKYKNKPICVIRNREMTPELYIKGFINGLSDNIGQRYPYYRLILHAIDNIGNCLLRKFHVKPKIHTAKLINFDNPVCSEWAAQFFVASGISSFKYDWEGINPDDFDDCRQKYPEDWETIFEGLLINGG